MHDPSSVPVSVVNRRVLIVDDDRDFADSLCNVLKLDGYRVRTAYDLADAAAALDDFPADVALVDIKMGEQNGLALVRDLKQRYPEVMCIIVTAYASAESAIQALQEGAYDFLCKPFYPEDLTATLERCFERITLARYREQAEITLR